MNSPNDTSNNKSGQIASIIGNQIKQKLLKISVDATKGKMIKIKPRRNAWYPFLPQPIDSGSTQNLSNNIESMLNYHFENCF